jgi:hypothetical protein
MSKREDGTFSRHEFRFDKKGDVYFCPQGRILETNGRVHTDHTQIYRASAYACAECPLKPKCCPNEPSRKIRRDVHEAAGARARKLAGTEAFARSAMSARRWRCALRILKLITALSECACAACPTRAMNSTSPLPPRT